MMKKILFAIMMCLPMTAMAQNTWEIQKDDKGVVTNPDAKYLTGAVPVVDGKVVFETTVEAPGKSAAQIYSMMKQCLTDITKEENQFEQSRIVLADTVKNQVVASLQEWLVFKSTPLVLDRTRLFYHIIADCKDGRADIKMTKIYYLYEEERDPQTLRAEEWITDEYGLKKGKNKLSRVTGKFRRKTIDRKDYLFDRFAKLLK